MQTFLPYPQFDRSAAVLDRARLGKQRVETLQVLRALELPDYGWGNHPAVRMWRGRTAGLVAYAFACLDEWTAAGRADSTRALVAEFAPGVQGRGQQDLADAGLLPLWLGDEELHRSHRSALLRKDPGTYRPLFGDADPDDLAYVWPAPDPAAPEPEVAARRVWVVRPTDADEERRSLAGGGVGLDVGSGVDVDVRGRAPGSTLGQLLAEIRPGRRPGKQVRTLTTFVEDVRPGEEVALLTDDGQTLQLGRFTGEYEFVTGSSAPHRRTVEWSGPLLQRVATPRPALLQDPRPLFRIPLPGAGDRS